MNYLIYIEHAAENLQFFLWHRDYTRRFSTLPENEQRLAPEWTVDQAEAEVMASQNTSSGTKNLSPETTAVFRGTEFAAPVTSFGVEPKGNPFNTPPRTPLEERESFTVSDNGWSDNGSTVQGSYKSSHQKKAAGAFEAADLKLQPCKYIQ